MDSAPITQNANPSEQRVAEAEKAKKETPKQQLEKKTKFIQQWAVAFSMSPERRINLFLNVKKGQRVETATPSVG